MQQLGIEAVASNTSVANAVYDPDTVVGVTLSSSTPDNNDTTINIDLKFYIGDGGKEFTVDLGSITAEDDGSNVTITRDIADLDTLVNRINTQAEAEGAPIVAINDKGRLKLVTENGETIAIEAHVRVSGSDINSVTINFDQLIEFSADVVTTSVTFDNSGNPLSTGDYYAAVAKTGRIDIAGIDSFFFEYSGVSSQPNDTSANGNKGLDFQINDKENAGVQNLYTIDVSTNAGAERALLIVKKAIQKVDTVRSQIGAVMNNLQSIYDAQKVAYDNTREAENVIRNVDFAKEMSEFTTLQIRMQSGVAMLAQANTLPQLVLQLLR